MKKTRKLCGVALIFVILVFATVVVVQAAVQTASSTGIIKTTFSSSESVYVRSTTDLCNGAFDKIDLYVDLINSGEELILDFYLTNKQLKNLLENIEEKVLSGEIDENKIDNAVTKILLMKGYEIISSI